jgi:hypothetical protein
MNAWLRKWPTEVGDAYLVSLVRAIVGVLLLLSALREVGDFSTEGFFGDVFHLPIVPEGLVPSRGVFVGLVVLECALAAMVVLGRGARPALLASAFIGTFLLLCDRIRYHNNRYALFLFAFLLAFAPCDRAFVLGRRVSVDRQGPLFAQRLAQVQLSIIYIASGGSKLLDPDWRSGLVIGDRLARSTALAISKGVPVELMRWLSEPSVSSALSKLAIATELVLAFALFFPRTRFVALWWGVMFHLTIEVTSKVELFGWLSLSIYALFARPALYERTLLYDDTRASGRWVGRAVRALDWLARFDVRRQEGGGAGPAFVVALRDGSSASGIVGLAWIARAIPLLFPLSLPLFVVSATRRGPRLGTKTA